MPARMGSVWPGDRRQLKRVARYVGGDALPETRSVAASRG